MWKSSVTFHEQNCPSQKKPEKDSASASSGGPSNAGISISSGVPRRGGGVQKRPKAMSLRLSNADRASLSAAKGGRCLPTTPMSPEEAPMIRDATAASRDDSVVYPGRSSCSSSTVGIISSTPSSAITATTAVQHTNALGTLSQGGSSGTQVSSVANGGNSVNGVRTPMQASAGCGQFTSGTPDGQPLPAPSTILVEKRVQSGGGRPPIIPTSLPKHYYGMQGVHNKEQTSGAKVLFDLRVPPTPVVASNGKPPMMFGAKLPKIPIAMELDDSDDEGPVKIVAAQDRFMRTGNPFGGFAPPTRCSPLPASSPIVCPGISPMPLSPLAPFSPLPPDSPAHNAPNPVHPPVNQSCARTNTNW